MAKAASRSRAAATRLGQQKRRDDAKAAERMESGVRVIAKAVLHGLAVVDRPADPSSTLRRGKTPLLRRGGGVDSMNLRAWWESRAESTPSD